MQLTRAHLDEFRETGILVIEDVFSPDEIRNTRDAFHKQLATLGIDHEAVLAKTGSVPGVRIKSPVSRIFYSKWKLVDVHLNERLSNLARDLLVNTYGSGSDPDFSHPFGPFSDIYAYVDRVCYRVPDYVQEEGGLGLHLDRNPLDPYLLQGQGLTKWRPIQSLVCLTDHFDGQSGGLKVVPGFHRQIEGYFKGHATGGECEVHGGEFCRLNGSKHTDLQRRCRPVLAPAGSVILWDNRLPHATAAYLSGADTREVIYTGFLPATRNNKAYVAEQAAALENNKAPPAYKEAGEEVADRDWDFNILNATQRDLLGFERAIERQSRRGETHA